MKETTILAFIVALMVILISIILFTVALDKPGAELPTPTGAGAGNIIYQTSYIGGTAGEVSRYIGINNSTPNYTIVYGGGGGGGSYEGTK